MWEYVAVLVLGVVLGWLIERGTVRVLREELARARAAEVVATDRLLHAWKEGATIPPRPTPAMPPREPLPAALQAEVDQWEDPEHRATLEARFRAEVAAGKSPVAILMALDNEHPA